PNLVDSINQGHLEPQTRVFGTVIFTEAQHNRPLLFVHRIERLVDDVTHYQNGRNGQNGTKSTCTAPGAAATARVATFAAKHAIKLVEPLLQRFIEVWWPLIIAATTTTGSPGIIVVTVSTRFIPGHSSLRSCLIEWLQILGIYQGPGNSRGHSDRPAFQPDHVLTYTGTAQKLQPVPVLQPDLQHLIAVVAMLFTQYRTRLVQQRSKLAIGRAKTNKVVHHILCQTLNDRVEQQWQTFSRYGRNPGSHRQTFFVAINSGLETIKQINLVEHLQHRNLIGSDFSQNVFHLFDVFIPAAVVTIDHMQQQRGL